MTGKMSNCMQHVNLESSTYAKTQINDMSNSIALLSNKATNFQSVLWSEQTNPTIHKKKSERNDSTDIPQLQCLKLNLHNPSRTLNTDIKIVSVITPPPHTKSCNLSKTSVAPNSHFRVHQLKRSGPTRLNKFVRRLHEMLLSEQNAGIVEWRKGLLVLHSTDVFTKQILPKYFGTKNFKTFRRQLNYYGFVHVRSFSATGSTTTALWVNQDLAKRGTKSISSVLMLKRVEPSDASKTAEGRRVRKEAAASTVEDIGINTHTMHLDQIRLLASRDDEKNDFTGNFSEVNAKNSSTIFNCQVSQIGTVSTMSNTSSRGSKSPSTIPASIDVIYTCSSAPDGTTANVASSQLVLPPQSRGILCTVDDEDNTTDSAANLLMMLSRSAY